MAEIIVKHPGLKITIEGQFGTPSELDLYTQAVVTLIRKAKIQEWQSQCEEAYETDDEGYYLEDQYRDALDEFCSAVLIAVAHLHRAENKYPINKQVKTEKLGHLTLPENDSMFGALLGIIGHLSNIYGMILGGDIRAEEPKDLN